MSQSSGAAVAAARFSGIFGILGCVGRGFLAVMLLSTAMIGHATGQITLGNSSNGVISNGSSLTLSHTNATGSNQVLMVGVSAQQPGASVTSITYGGAALSKLGALSNSSQSRVEIWYLKSPPAGTYNLVVTNSQADNAVIGVLSVSGVNQTTPFGTLATAQGNGTTASVSPASASGELVFGLSAFNNGGTHTQGAGQSEHWDNTINSSISGSGTSKAGASSVNISATSASAPWSIAAVSMKPATAVQQFASGNTSGGSSASVAAGGNLTFSHTPGTGANRLLLVSVIVGNPAVSDEAAPGVVTGVTFGGTPMTLVGSAYSGNAARTYVYRLVNPVSATGNVVVSIGTKASGVQATATTFNGVNQTTPLGAPVTFIGNGTDYFISGTVGAAVGDLVYSAVAVDEYVGVQQGVTTYTGQTELFNGSGFDWVSGATSTKPGASSVSLRYNFLDYEDSCMVAVAINPASAATSGYPGGVANASLWLKADTGVTSGSTFTWSDQSGAGWDVSQSTASNQPALAANSVNFNPAVVFDGSNDFLSRTGISFNPSSDDFFAVVKPNTASGDRNIIGMGSSGWSGDVHEFRFSNNRLQFGVGQSWSSIIAGPATDGVWNLANANRTTAWGGAVLRNFGAQVASGTITAVPTQSQINIGARRHLGANDQFLDGRIAEVVIFPNQLTAANRAKVESYLALKYGITLDQTSPQNYIASNGSTTFWSGSTNSGYNKNIAGIGRDDATGLNQKQSASVNSGFQIVVGNGNTIAADNPAHPYEISANLSALVWGDNGGSVASWTATGAPAGHEIVSRVWKVQETGTVGSVRVRVSDNSGGGLPDEKNGAVKLLVGSSANFGSGATAYPMTLAGPYWEADVNLAGGQYLTFANELPPAVELVYTGSAPDFYEGNSSLPITVRLLDAFGDPVKSVGDTVVTLSSAPGTGSFRSADDTATITTVTIPAGQSESSFRFTSDTLGTYQLTASFGSLTPAVSSVNVLERPANLLPVQTYYIPVPENQLLSALSTIAYSATTYPPVAQRPKDPVTMYSVITIGASSTIVYYDQMENGYEETIHQPASIYHATLNPSGTQIWGDGDPSNGMPPGYTQDILNAGNIISLFNSFAAGSQTASSPKWNAGDKFASTRAIAATWAGWADGSKTLLAGADEMFDTLNWGTDYRVPVGENIFASPLNNGIGEMFQYTGAAIMAGRGGATVQIDADANGSFEASATLAEGQSHFINGGLQVGARFLSDKPVQVDLFTGDKQDGFESRFYRLVPTDRWGSDYHTPVSSPNTTPKTFGTSFTATGWETTVWLYNPGGSPITVTYQRRASSNRIVNADNKGIGYANPAMIAFNESPNGNIYGPLIALNADGTLPTGTTAPQGTWIGIATTSGFGVATAVDNAQKAGARALVIQNTSATALPDPATTIGAGTGATSRVIPVVGVTGNQGTTMRNASGPGTGWVRVSGDQTTSTLSVPAGGFVRQVLDPYYAGRFYSSGAPFYALSTTDSTGTTLSTGSGNASNSGADWGYTLTPKASLSPQVQVAMGIGRDPTSATNPDENGSPIWVAPVGNGNTDAAIYVDFDADASTGAFTDPNGNKYDMVVKARELERVRVYNPNPPSDSLTGSHRGQNGAILYTLDKDTNGDPIRLAVSWGQDPLVSSPSQPGLDMGTGIPPQPAFNANKRSFLVGDNDGDGFLTVDDDMEYEITIINPTRVPVDDVWLKDVLPASVAYVPGSAHLEKGDGTNIPIPDDSAGTPFPLDGTGCLLPAPTLLQLETWLVRFKVRVVPFSDLPQETKDTQTIVNTFEVWSPIHLPAITGSVTDPIYASVGDFVWVDRNANGLQDADEPALAGVEVKLFDGSGALLSTTTTDADGFYRFAGLTAGDYRVEFAAPSGSAFSTASIDGEGLRGPNNSDPNAGGSTPVFTLVGAEPLSAVDAGLYVPASISGTIRIDTTGDRAGDTAHAGVVVTLLDQKGFPVLVNGNPLTATTNGNGQYTFGNLTPGIYQVSQAVPAPFHAVNDIDGGSLIVIGDITPITLISGQNVTGQDFVNAEPGSIGDFVWNDTNGNGLQDPGESGLQGVTVTVVDSEGNTVASTTTDASGKYGFANLIPGSYRVIFTAPDGYDFSNPNQGEDDTTDSDADPLTGETSVTVLPGTSITTIDAGLHQPGSIGDHVWNDANEDGLQDSGETGLNGVTVELLDGSGTVVATTVTGDDGMGGPGHYLFDNLSPGTYSIRFIPTLGYEFSPWNADNGGIAGTANSDANPLTGQTAAVTLQSNQDVTYADAGLVYNPNSLGDYAWIDANGNGIQNTGETGLNGVTVQLLDGAGNPMRTTTTADDGSGNPGHYLFVNLPPGKYSVRFVAPSGYVLSAHNTDTQGIAGQVNSDANPITGLTTQLTIQDPAGEILTFVDAGLYQPASVGDHVWNDLNGNGIQDPSEPGIGGVTVTLSGNDGAGNPVDLTTATDGTGFYEFANLAPGDYTVTFTAPDGFVFTASDAGDDALDSDASLTTGAASVNVVSGTANTTVDAGFYQPVSIGEFVWVDTDMDGTQGGGEAGLNGVTVELLDGGGTVVSTTTTANNPVGGAPGYYLFDNLAPGTYSVRFVKPSGYVLTTQSGGISSANNSDADTTTGQTAQVTLGSGDAVRYVDAGVYQLASLGDYVWMDLDKDGVQNDGANSGVNGVTVELLDGSGTVIATTVTADDGGGNPGFYHFGNLVPGTYSVRFTAPDGLVFTWQNGGASATDNSDSDRVTGETAQVALAAGDNITYLDAGLKCPDTWSDWKLLHPGEDAAGNLDADAYDNFAEYAFAMPDDGTGSGHLDRTAWIIQPSTLAPGTLEAVFVRPTGWNTANGQGAVTYVLQYAASAGQPTVWQEVTIDLSNATVTDNGDCTETVVIHDIETLTGMTGGTGVVRVEATQADPAGPDSGATTYSEPEGWTETPLEGCCQTYGTPYQRETVFTGTVDAVAGQDLAFVGNDLTNLLAPGVSYYAEVLSGDNAGQRFDVAATGDGTVTLAADADILSAAPPFNTLATVPASLAGDIIAIRPHWTLGGLFPVAGLVASNSNTSADQVQTYAAGAWTTYWLYDLGDADPATARWVKTGDPTLADQSGAVIPPGQGMFFTKRGAAAAILSYGEIRTNPFVRPLATGAQSNLVSGGYPVDQSPLGRELSTAEGFLGTKDFKTADSIFVWQNDASPPFNSGYDTYWLLHSTTPQALNRWVKQGDATIAPKDSAVLFEYDRAVFLRTAADQTTYRVAAPWAP